MLHKTKNILNKIVIPIILFTTILLNGSALDFFVERQLNAAVSDSSIVTFTNPDTFEQDVKGYIQSNIDVMNNVVTFRVRNSEIQKRFFETDSNGDYIYREIEEDGQTKTTLTFSSYLSDDLINTTFYNMKPDNYKAYARLAYGGYDNPTKYYATLSSGNSGDILEIRIEFGFFDLPNSLSAIRSVENHAKAFLNSNEYKSKKTDDARLKAINDYITRTFQYDYRLFVEGERSVIYSAYEMINDTSGEDGHPIDGYPRGVCQAYTLYGYIMLKLAGYDAITIDGTTGESNEFGVSNHSWNMVKVGKYWYHVDFTWNDPVSNFTRTDEFNEYSTRQAGITSLDYILKTDAQMSKTHTWNKTSYGFRYPVASNNWTGVTVKDTNPTPTLTPKPSPTVTPTIPPTPTITQPISAITPIAPSDSSSMDELLSEDSSFTPSPTGDLENDNGDKFIYSSRKNLSVIISGFLQDENSNPIPDIFLELFSSSGISKTNERGYYRFDDIDVGNYKLYAKDRFGNELASMDVVISFGAMTEYSDGVINVNGGRLQMDLILSENTLNIKSVKNDIQKTYYTETIVGFSALILILAALITIFSIKKNKDNTESGIYLE